MEYILTLARRYFSWLSFPELKITDIIEILLLAFLIYKILVWVKNTKGWNLLKGILIVALFVIVAAVFQMSTILWLVQKLFSILAIAAVVVFAPEIRRALERLGEREYLSRFLPFTTTRQETGLFTDKVISDIVRATQEMAKRRTGALIVIERKTKLTEYERTGIMMDSLVSSQLLLNIFEHNTPLHDGAIIIRGNRIVAATCYLPLSNNRLLSKDLGTRHRAGLGLSEACDAFVIIVSEETGGISFAENGTLKQNMTPDMLRLKLKEVQDKPVDKRNMRIGKGQEANAGEEKN